MLFPVGIEDSRVRRVPFVTFGIMGLCVLLFLVSLVVPQDQSQLYLEQLVSSWLMDPRLDFPEACILNDEQRRLIEVERKRDQKGMNLLREVMDEEISADAQESLDLACSAYLHERDHAFFSRLSFVPSRGLFQLGLITHMFMHAGWFHLIFNLAFFLLVSGPFIEDVMGRGNFAGFYLLGGICGALAEYCFAPGSSIPMVGASGAISAATGAFVVRFVKRKVGFVYFFYFGIRIATGRLFVPAWAAGAYWFGRDLIGLVFWRGHDGIAHWAHMGGFLFGGFVAFAMLKWKLEERWGIPLHDHYRLGVERVDEAAMAFAGREHLLGPKPTELAPIRERPDIPERLAGVVDVVVKAFKKRNDDEASRRFEWILRKVERPADDVVLAWLIATYTNRIRIDHFEMRDLLTMAQVAATDSQWLQALRFYEHLAKANNRASTEAKVRVAEITYRRLARWNSARELALAYLNEIPSLGPGHRSRLEALLEPPGAMEPATSSGTNTTEQPSPQARPQFTEPPPALATAPELPAFQTGAWAAIPATTVVDTLAPTHPPPLESAQPPNEPPPLVLPMIQPATAIAVRTEGIHIRTADGQDGGIRYERIFAIGLGLVGGYPVLDLVWDRKPALEDTRVIRVAGASLRPEVFLSPSNPNQTLMQALVQIATWLHRTHHAVLLPSPTILEQPPSFPTLHAFNLSCYQTNSFDP